MAKHLDLELWRSLAKQLSDPKYMYIKTARGRLVTHSDKLDPMYGKPVRFSSFAASRILPELPGAVAVSQI